MAMANKLHSLSDCTHPTCSKGIRSFWDFPSAFRQFLNNFAHKSYHLAAFFEKQALWQLGPSEQLDYLKIKGVLPSVRTLVHFNDSAERIAHINASQKGLGVVLLGKDVQRENWVVA